MRDDDNGDNFYSIPRAKRLYETELIECALRESRWNRTRAAKLLEISHRSLLYKIKEYKIYVPPDEWQGYKIGRRIKRGMYIDAFGYVIIDSDYHPHAEGRTRMKEHTVVMEKHIGRRIVKGECVHHIDTDKRNNNIDNLLLLTPSEHSLLHVKLYPKGGRKPTRDESLTFLREIRKKFQGDE